MYKPCIHGCQIKDKNGKPTGQPVMAVLDPTVYRFKNNGKPYRLRHCPACDRWMLVLED